MVEEDGEEFCNDSFIMFDREQMDFEMKRKRKGARKISPYSSRSGKYESIVQKKKSRR